MSIRLSLLIGILLVSTQIRAENSTEKQMIVRLEKGVSLSQFEVSVLDADGEPAIEVIEPLVPDLDLYLVKVREGNNTRSTMSTLNDSSLVMYAQPNRRVQKRAVQQQPMPNDMDFLKQWGLNNQSHSGADIKALDAWKMGTGGVDKLKNEMVVAVVDGGFDIKHTDLVDNVWVNKGEVPGNGKDDDGNGYIDDINGWNAFDNNGEILVDPHATHVAGIVGATGNNGKFVTGVNWKVKIMAVDGASTDTATVAKAYGYVAAQKKLYLKSKGKKGAFVVATNSSFGVDFADCNSAEFKAWNDLYDYMGSLGILSAAATANKGIDVDVQGDVPTGCASPYIISVTNTTVEDKKSEFAAWGKNSIDLGAPGTNILSTLPNDQVGEESGTSMSTPHVAGAIALLHSLASKDFANLSIKKPAVAALEMKKSILSSVDLVEELKDTTVSGGRLNLAKAMVALRKFKNH